ncbi:MAG: TolC family protein [Gemmatimonadales bacterium]|jgi:outer membrane protein TolC
MRNDVPRHLIGVVPALLAVLTAPIAAQTVTVTLDEAVDLALQVNPAIVQARGQVNTAGAAKREVIGSWLPSLNTSSSWSRNSSSRWDERTQTTITGASSSMSAGINSSLTLFDGFRRFAEARSAAADVESADAALVNQEFQIALQTKQAFFNALAADELVRLSELRIERARNQLRISSDKLAAGSATRSDTLRSRVELANAELQLLQAQTQRATAEANLARLIGVDGTVRAVADSSLFAPVRLDTAVLRREAQANAPSVIQADAALRAAEAGYAVSRSQYFPTLNSSFSSSYSGQTLSQLNSSWSIRLSLSWPLFNGFSRETAVARSAASRDAAAAQSQDARLEVNAQLTQYLASLASAEARIEIAEVSYLAAEEDLRVQQERYRLGAATIVEVLTSQVSLDQAAVDIVQARLDYLVAKAQAEALVGREL